MAEWAPIGFNIKKPDMKLSKALLSAILIGIAVQGSTSCKKSKDDDSKQKQEAQKKEEEKKATTDPCPACGMG